jgi:hypothetical protein
MLGTEPDPKATSFALSLRGKPIRNIEMPMKQTSQKNNAKANPQSDVVIDVTRDDYR